MVNTDPWNPDPIPPILELDHVFEALGHPRRRYLLYTLLEETEWTLWDLASKIAAWEYEYDDQPPPEAAVENVYVSLRHNHVPKLAEDEIVAFSEPEEMIAPASNTQQVLDVLESAGGSTDTRLETHARGDHSEGQS